MFKIENRLQTSLFASNITVLILHSKTLEIKFFAGVVSSRAFLKAELKTEDSSEALSYAGLLAELIKKLKKKELYVPTNTTCIHIHGKCFTWLSNK